MNSPEWKSQQFVAFQTTKLLDKHKELFIYIFGEQRTEGLKKMLWFYPHETYPQGSKLTEIDFTRRVGLKMFLGEEDASASLSQEQALSPTALLGQLPASSQQYNLTQPQAAEGSHTTRSRGSRLVAQLQVDAERNLGQFSDTTAIAEDVHVEKND